MKNGQKLKLCQNQKVSGLGFESGLLCLNMDSLGLTYDKTSTKCHFFNISGDFQHLADIPNT